MHYIRQVAFGLDFAFRGGIIHRDIKPGNILVDRTGATKLLDLGLARFYKDTTDMLTVKYDDKIVLGTADYVAPEQVANSHAVDVRADIYALGASFYFVLAGHPPFPNGTVSQKLLWHRTKDPTPIRQIRPEVPEGIAAIVAKMMHKDLNRRFATPADVAEALESWDPTDVPLPAEVEMPQLSPAALEGVEQPIEQYVAPSSKLLAKIHEPDAVPRSELRSLLAAKGSPFGVPALGPPSELRSKLAPKASPFGVASAVVEMHPMPARTPDPSAFSPNRTSVSVYAPATGRVNYGAESNPVAAPQADVSTNAQMQDPTPHNIVRPRYRPSPRPFPVIARTPQNTGMQTRKVILFGLLAACVVAATLLLTWKFLVAPK